VYLKWMKIIKNLNNSESSVLFLFFSALLAYFVHVPEKIILGYIIYYFIINIIINPKYGINFLILITPFCLGNSKRPYFIYIELLVYLIICASIIHFFLLKNRKFLKIYFFPLILLFVIISILNVPLNCKELYYYIKGTPLINVCYSFISSNEGYNTFYLRSFSNLLSSIALFIITFIFMQKKDFLQLAKSMILMLFITCIFIFIFRYDLIQHKTSFLTLQFLGQYGTSQGKVMCGFAYNPGYLGQYLISVLPFSILILLKRKQEKLWLIISSLVLFLSLLIIPLTFQRGPIIALFLQINIFVIYLLLIQKNKKTKLKISIIFFIIIPMILLLTDYFFNHGFMISKFDRLLHHMGLRGKIWQVAFAMLKANPLLGVGIGKFHYFFPQYCAMASVNWSGSIQYVRSTAHNLYLHMLAEQGILGFTAFIFLIITIVKQAVISLKKMEKEAKTATISILIILTGMMTFGLSQYIFYIRIMQIYFWCILGFLVVIIKPYINNIYFPKKLYSLTTILLIGLFLYRLYIIKIYII